MPRRIGEHPAIGRDGGPEKGFRFRSAPARTADHRLFGAGRKVAAHDRPGDGRVERQVADVACIIKRSEEHTSELQSLMRISYAVLCLTQKRTKRDSRIATKRV